ncbi:MAG: hypothetical protein ABIO39_13535 [Caulobacteraceae bacterium]
MTVATDHIEQGVADVVTNRLTNTSGREVLNRLAEAGLVERGCVVMLSLDAIRDRLGDRWERRRDQVWDSAMAHIEKRLTPRDVSARVGETDIAIAILAGREEAQTVGLKCLQELLIFFLGSYSPNDMKVQFVTSISGEHIACTHIEPPLGLMEDAAPMASAPAPAGKPAAGSGASAPWSTMSFTRGNVTQTLDQALLLETLLSIRRPGEPATIGMAVHPVWTDGATGRRASPYLRANFTLAEQLAVDKATLEFASQVLQIDGAALVVPVSFEVASSSRGRALLSSWIGEHSAAIGSRIILELVHLSAGTPRGRLLEVAAGLAARVPRIMARAEPSRAMVALLQDCRIAGVSLDCSGTSREDLPGLLKAFGRAAKSIAPVLCALGIPNAEAAETAREAGFSHATLDAG